VPTFLVGKEDVTNRATTATIMDAWSKSKLEKERTWLRGIIEPQWNDRNLQRIIKSGIVEKNLPPDKPPLATIQYTDPRTGKPTRGNVNPNNPFASANAADNPFPVPKPSQTNTATSPDATRPTTSATEDNPIPSRAIDPETPISKLEFKIKREFEPIILDTVFETAQAIVALIGAGVIDETAARKVLHFEDIEARMKDQEAQNQQMAQMIATGQAAQFQQMKGAENKAMNNNKQQDQQKQSNNPFAGQSKSSGIQQVGSNAPQINMSASGSISTPEPNSPASAAMAAAKLRMQADKKRLDVYNEISEAVKQIVQN